MAASQPWVTLPGQAWARERCFRPGTAAKVGLGLASGFVFGASNAAVPGLVGVAAGQRLRRRLPDAAVTAGALLLRTVIGGKLLVDGLTAL